MGVGAAVRPVAGKRRDRSPTDLLGALLALIAALVAPPMHRA